ncbi:hypothetical protein PSPO_a1764 [Pseudoalteromonas spongiae UST010723-006]|nr:hypothetical protein PSPO_a1764 [Pseudoalteromonas spongiae UST010723-006]
MLTALEFINVEQLHKKNSALLPFHISSAILDHILNRIGISDLFIVKNKKTSSFELVFLY